MKRRRLVPLPFNRLRHRRLRRGSSRRRPLRPWLAAFLSNLASIPLDNFLFAFGAFAFALPWGAVWQIFLFNLAVKAVVSLAGIPLLSLVKEDKQQ